MTYYNREDQFLRQRLQKEIPILRALIQNLYEELDRKLHLNGAKVPITFGYDTDTLGSYTRRSVHEKEHFHFSLFFIGYAVKNPLSKEDRMDLYKHEYAHYMRYNMPIPKQYQWQPGIHGSAWKYYQTWTIGKWNGTVFETLNYEETAFNGKTLALTLEPGCYRLITSMRMPNGDQHAAYRVFELKAGEAKEIYLEAVKKELDELLEHIELPEITLEDLDGKAHTLNDLTKDGPILLAFLGTGEEPTEHVLNELIEIAEKWNAKDAAMAAVLRTKADLENTTFQKARAAIHNMSLYLDPSDDAPAIAEKMGIDAEKLPLLILALPGNIGGRAYAGYNVGSVGLMLRLMEEAAKA